MAAQALGLAAMYALCALKFHDVSSVVYSFFVGAVFLVIGHKPIPPSRGEAEYAALPGLHAALFYTFLALVSVYVVLAMLGHNLAWIVVACGVQLSSLIKNLVLRSRV